MSSRTIRLLGDLTAAQEAEQFANLFEFVGGERVDQYIVDLASIALLDAIGLVAVMTIRNLATRLGSETVLTNVSSRSMAVLLHGGLTTASHNSVVLA